MSPMPSRAGRTCGAATRSTSGPSGAPGGPGVGFAPGPAPIGQRRPRRGAHAQRRGGQRLPGPVPRAQRPGSPPPDLQGARHRSGHRSGEGARLRAHRHRPQRSGVDGGLHPSQTGHRCGGAAGPAVHGVDQPAARRTTRRPDGTGGTGPVSSRPLPCAGSPMRSPTSSRPRRSSSASSVPKCRVPARRRVALDGTRLARTARHPSGGPRRGRRTPGGSPLRVAGRSQRPRPPSRTVRRGTRGRPPGPSDRSGRVGRPTVGRRLRRRRLGDRPGGQPRSAPGRSTRRPDRSPPTTSGPAGSDRRPASSLLPMADPTPARTSHPRPSGRSTASTPVSGASPSSPPAPRSFRSGDLPGPDQQPQFRLAKGQITPQTTLVLGIVCGALLSVATLLGRRAPVGFVALFTFLAFGTADFSRGPVPGAGRVAAVPLVQAPEGGVGPAPAGRRRRASSKAASSQGRLVKGCGADGGPGPVGGSRSGASKGKAKAPGAPEANKRYTPKRPPPPPPKPSRRDRKAGRRPPD